MTIGGWMAFAVFALIAIGGGILAGWYVDKRFSKVYGAVAGVVLSAILLFGMLWYFNNTASGSRALKTQESNFNYGIRRKVTVYSVDGKIIDGWKRSM